MQNENNTEHKMGLFDFVKGIGKKNTAPSEPQPTSIAATELSVQEISNKLLGHVKGLGLPITGLSVTYNATSDLVSAW